VLEPVSKFFRLHSFEQVLILRAWFWLGLYRVDLAMRPLKSQFQDLQLAHVAVAHPTPTSAQLEQARMTGLAISRAASMTPWRSSCLLQVLVGRRLLRRQGIPGTLFLGVQTAGLQQQTGLYAHAWLKCGSEVINGNSGHLDYRVLVQQQWV